MTELQNSIKRNIEWVNEKICSYEVPLDHAICIAEEFKEWITLKSYENLEILTLDKLD